MYEADIDIRDVVFVHALQMPHLVLWHSRWHGHDPGEMEFHYFLDGAGSFKQAGTVYSIERGSLFFSPPGVEHAIVTNDLDNPITYYAVLFAVAPRSRLAGVVANKRFLSSFPGRIGVRRRVRFEEIKNKYVHDNPYYRSAACHDLASFIFDLAAALVERRQLPVSSDEHSIHVDRLLALFQRHLDTPRPLSDFAGEVGVSPEHLIRLFRSRFAISPMAYYRRLRLEAASSLLLNTTDSVKEIAWRTGYEDQDRFSAAFKKYAGVSPSRYREQYYQSNPTDYAVRVLPATGGGA